MRLVIVVISKPVIWTSGARSRQRAIQRCRAPSSSSGQSDRLVFAGGIGENAPLVRSRICEGLGFLGIKLDDSRNAESAAVISENASRVTIRVIRTDEELMIARSVTRVLHLGTHRKQKP